MEIIPLERAPPGPTQVAQGALTPRHHDR